MPVPKKKFGVSATLIGQADLIRTMQRWEFASRGAARRIVNHFAMEIHNKAKENLTEAGVVDRGRARSSIRVDFYNDGSAANVIAAVDYAAFIEFGTGPRGKQGNLFGGPLPPGYTHHSGNGKLPPLDLIEAWVKRKGITVPVGMTRRSLAFLIAKKIAKQGLPARPFMYPAFAAVQPDYEREIGKFLINVKRDVS